jgi:hypothetical protein
MEPGLAWSIRPDSTHEPAAFGLALRPPGAPPQLAFSQKPELSSSPRDGLWLMPLRALDQRGLKKGLD